MARSSAFALNLYKNVAKGKGIGDNIALSPFSAEAALGMTHVGAVGTTKSELGSALGITEKTSGDFAKKIKTIGSGSSNYTLKSANAIFVEETCQLNAGFKEKVHADFGGDILAVDFLHRAPEATGQINLFVKEKTANKIVDLFAPDSLDASTRLVLVNAVYFKARWANEFEPQANVVENFTTSNGTSKNTDFMKKTAYFNYIESAELGGAQLLQLEYEHYETNMVFILPKKEAGLEALENLLTGEKLDGVLNQLSSGSEVEVSLPKFVVDTTFELKSPLQNMGIKTGFSDEADFSGISSGRLQISKVLHKVFVGVDEKGTEAAAATAVEMMCGCSFMEKPKPKIFRADHPFLFLIRHKESNTILFMGRVADPTSKK